MANLLLVSGPIGNKLWTADLAFLIGVLVIICLAAWLGKAGAVEAASWAFPLRGRWLRRFVEAMIVATVMLCLFLLISTGGCGMRMAAEDPIPDRLAGVTPSRRARG